MFSRNLRARFDLLRPNIGNHVSQKQEKQKLYFHSKNTRYLNINQTEIVKDYRSNNKWVEGTIVRQLSEVMYIVKYWNIVEEAC